MNFDLRLPIADLLVCDAFHFEGVSATPSRKPQIKNQQSEMEY